MKNELKNELLKYLDGIRVKAKDDKDNYPDYMIKDKVKMDKLLIELLKSSQDVFMSKKSLFEYLSKIDDYIREEIDLLNPPTPVYNDLIVSVFENLMIASVIDDYELSYSYLKNAKEYMHYIRKNFALYLDTSIFPLELFRDLKPILEVMKNKG
ncbi:hypothetical protein [Acholeplasma laidlawii]|uniref:Uncharacterized protein n=2 Tax=Acholeplasma laidlawii TaxID=2148 RepID=A9NH09_ACHLI|nr:hypothetical protein [Acholeplasma laidlawii]ABX81639.1 hypothetical protein ACL_1029 [Acholeplasma laidlawii PG-8A]NWH09787.1 hypothetical protein [Acholeplasma laidlawii]NWH11177.1 hypothetical protein [Acholeplasma laidlawii]NWH13412.1 hypothetical protein [Acholeplasma laidlawii]NWH14039.1 hypothetical protein [Acholeplasma laidlawii]